MVWSKNLDPVRDAGNLPIGTSSPFIFSDIVYVGSLSGEMNAYDLENGRKLWGVDEKQPINAQVGLFGEQIIYGTRFGRVFSRHYLTGKIKYSIDLGAPIESAPVIHKGWMFFHLRNHKIMAFDAATGKVFWHYTRAIPYTTTLQRVSRVLPLGNKLIVGFADGFVVALSLEEGVTLWETKISEGYKFVDVDVDPIYFAGKVVAGAAAGPLRFIDPEKGIVTNTIPFTVSHTPIKFNGNLLVGSNTGSLYLVDKDGRVLKKKKITDSSISAINIWKNKIVVSSFNGELILLDKVSFKRKADYHLGSSESTVFGRLQVANGKLALYSSRNRLYIFK